MYYISEFCGFSGFDPTPAWPPFSAQYSVVVEEKSEIQLR